MLTILVFVSQDKFDKLIDIIAIVNAQNMGEEYIFHEVQVHANGKIFKVQAMIDTGTIFNLLTEDLISEYNILMENKVPFFTAANRSKMHLYKQSHVAIKTHGHDGS